MLVKLIYLRSKRKGWTCLENSGRVTILIIKSKLLFIYFFHFYLFIFKTVQSSLCMAALKDRSSIVLEKKNKFKRKLFKEKKLIKYLCTHLLLHKERSLRKVLLFSRPLSRQTALQTIPFHHLSPKDFQPYSIAVNLNID